MSALAAATRSVDSQPAASSVQTAAPVTQTPTPAPTSTWMQAAPPAVSLSSGGTSAAAGSFTGGEPLPSGTRHVLETSFHTNLQPVRVHTDTQAHNLTQPLSTRAVTYGTHIFLWPGEQPSDSRLMSHEAAHVLQQRGAPSLQNFTSSRGDVFEGEAEQASAAVLRGESFAVHEQTGPRMQGFLGIDIPNPLDWLANKANVIPGFRMFTIILGMN